MLNSIKDIKNYIKENKPEWKMLDDGDLYFTVKNKEGYMAYVQADTFGCTDDPQRFMAIAISTVHRANKKTGNGYVDKKFTSGDYLN